MINDNRKSLKAVINHPDKTNNYDNINHLVSYLGSRLTDLEKRVDEKDKLNIDDRLDRLENIVFLRNIHSISDLLKLRFGELARTLKKIVGGINFEDRHFQSRLNRLKSLYYQSIYKLDGIGPDNEIFNNCRIYIDITQTLSTDTITGISRVSKELALAAMELGVVPVFQWGLAFVAYDPVKGDYRKVTISKDDILFLPDASWLSPGLEEVVNSVKNKGGKIAFLLHDIIPVRYPHFCDPYHNRLFTKWLTEIVFAADCIVSVTESISLDAEKYMDEIEAPVESRPAMRWSHSGVNLSASIDEDSPHSYLFRIASRPSYLSVGAIEPKKNYTVILDAVEMAWAAGADFNYIIVGSYGWGQTNLKNRILNHAEYSNRLHWLQTISDPELVYLYENCHYLIQGSVTEGFGLPVVEAARCGLSAICSDIPVLKEITQGTALYFQTKDSNQLAKIIKDTSIQDKIPCPIRPDTWAVSARRTVKILNGIISPVSASPKDLSRL